MTWRRESSTEPCSITTVCPAAHPVVIATQADPILHAYSNVIHVLTDATFEIDLGRNSPCRTGTITCLEFYGSSHLLSGGEDGLVCVWDTKKWQCLKSIRAHKYAAKDATEAEVFVSVASWLRKHEPSCPLLSPRGSVMSLSVHPSGKLALTVGTDQTLRWTSDVLQMLIEGK